MTLDVGLSRGETRLRAKRSLIAQTGNGHSFQWVVRALNFSNLNPSASEMILHIPILFFFGVTEDGFRFQIIFSILRYMEEMKPLPLFLMTLWG